MTEHDRDAGSMTPMILGLAFMLLLLVAGVSAVGSAFLARQDVQHVCDGAAAVAGDAVSGVDGDPVVVATRAAQQYLSKPGRRPLQVQVAVRWEGGAPRLTCSGRTEVSFAGLFELQDVEFVVQAAGRPGVTIG